MKKKLIRTTLTCRITPELKQFVKQAARRIKLTPSAYVEDLVVREKNYYDTLKALNKSLDSTIKKYESTVNS